MKFVHFGNWWLHAYTHIKLSSEKVKKNNVRVRVSERKSKYLSRVSKSYQHGVSSV